MTNPASENRIIGKPFVTVESARLVRGRGQFIDDIQLPRMLHIELVRSPHAHARILRVDASAALEMPGVVTVLTGAELVQRSGPLFSLAAVPDPPLPIHMYALAHEKVRFVGEAVAAVAAEDRYTAADAAARVQVDYAPLPPVMSAEAALAPAAVLVHEAMGSNVMLRRRLAWGNVDGLFARADRVVRRRITWGRHHSAALDTFGCIADYNEASGDLTIWSNSQSYTLLRTLAQTLRLPEHRVIGKPVDVGGAFGGKFWQPRPMALCALLAMQTGRPVKFIEDRFDHMAAGENHGEQRIYEAELALTHEGDFLALRFKVLEDQGAYFLLGPTSNAEPLAQVIGAYQIQAVEADITITATNKTGQGAYRGFGTTALAFMIERLVDAAAQELGLDHVEIRRRNFLQPEQFPYVSPTGNIYDSGNYPEALNRALALADYDGWRAKQAQARAEGRFVGVGVAAVPERSVPSLTGLWVLFEKRRLTSTTSAETVTLRIDQDGRLRVGLHSPGLGTAVETVATMVMAEEFGADTVDIRVTRFDTSVTGPATGVAASRMTVMVAGAAGRAAAVVKQKMKQVAAHLLEARVEDIEYDAVTRTFGVVGVPDRGLPFKQIANHANARSLHLPDGMESGLEATITYDHPAASLPNDALGSWGSFCPIMGFSVHVPVVEVDLETGQVRFLDYAVLHDCGTVVNPDALKGQVIGGVCQGIGTTLFEECRYDATGQPLFGSLRDYPLPTTMEMPHIRIGHLETPSPFTYRGVKGAGEGGRIVAPAAIVAAIEDALRPLGIQIHEIPMTPERLRAKIRGALRQS
jgi:CO/xanthine dehydrogenase Mo-binding subunit